MRSSLFDVAYYAQQLGGADLRGRAPIVHYLEDGAARGFDPNPLFDSSWYQECNPEVADSGVAPLVHFLRSGAAAGRDPHPLFQVAWYVGRAPDAARDGNPLAHFLARKAGAAPRPNPLFDPAWYAERHPEVAAAGWNALVHYVSGGETGGCRPNAVFDPRWYRAMHPQIGSRSGAALAHYLAAGAAAGAAPSPLFDPVWYAARRGIAVRDALADYLEHRAAAGCDPHPLFRAGWYLRRCPAAAVAPGDPLAHFADCGARAGLSPHPLFDTAYYLARNPDVARAVGEGALDPLSHFLAWGAAEGRRPHPLFDPTWYRAKHPAVARSAANPLIHYVEDGAARDLPPSPLFHPRWYRSQHEGIAAEGIAPLAHHSERRGEPGFEPNPLFRHYVRFFLPSADLPEFADPDANPLAAYVLDPDADPRRFGEAPALAFAAVAQPEATVLIPAYDQRVHTLACLRSLAAARTEAAFEVLLVDDASPGTDYRDLCGRVPNLHVLRNETNLGFVRSCNRGAEAARGRTLVLLNNDTIVTDGWLDELLATFDKMPSVGAVGSKLLFPSGMMAEAGCIVWRDGSAWNFGRRHAPDSPEVEYARPADYVSAAALAIERSFFLELGGFDEAFAPAYYEDADLAFRIRRAGRRVLVQPASEVVHFEGVSSVADPEAGMKTHQALHRSVFAERWGDAIRDHAEPGVEPDREKDRAFCGRALVLDTATPEPGRDSRSLRQLHLMRILLERGYRVSFAPTNGLAPALARRALQSHGIHVLHRPWLASVEQLLDASAPDYDVVLVCRQAVAKRHLAELRARFPAATLLFDVADLLAPPALAHLLGAAANRSDEIANLADLADATLVAVPESTWSEVTAQGVRAGVHNVPWIYEAPRRTAGFETRRDLFLIANLVGPADVEGLAWLTREVLPILAREVPALRLQVPPRPALRALAGLDARTHAWSEAAFIDPRSLDRIRVAVAPSRFGPGLAGRVQPALARGVPSVATSHAASNLPPSLRASVVVADDAESFARAILRLYCDAAAWATASSAGRTGIAELYSYEKAREQLQRILATCKPRGRGEAGVAR